MTASNTLTMLSDFSKGNAGKAFTGMAVTHAEFAAQVRSRIERPHEIYQGSASLCGPAAFMYCMIRKNAMAYAKYAMDLRKRCFMARASPREA